MLCAAAQVTSRCAWVVLPAPSMPSMARNRPRRSTASPLCQPRAGHLCHAGAFGPVIHEPVANAALIQDIAWVRGICFQFLAQIRDIEPQVLVLVAVLVPPHFGQ